MNIEEIFWSQIDPMYHLKQASCIRYADNIDSHYLLQGDIGNADKLRAELLSGFEEMKASGLMFIRFHAVETLFTALLGSYPHGPVPRFAKKFRNSDLNEAIKSIARQEIPTKLKIPGVSKYQEWLRAKFWGRLPVEDVLNDDIIRFISVQARLFENKTA